MNAASATIAEKYADTFDNFDEVAHPAIFHLPAFDTLLQKALERGSALTREEVEKEFGEQAWEW